MITINNLSKAYGTRVLFKDLSFNVGKGEKIGLVARNGYGKTTLLQMILGLVEYDSGEIQIPKNYKIGYLEQHINFKYNSVMEEVTSVMPKTEVDQSWKAEKILFGLGFTKETIKQNPLMFSGGYKIRINLAKILLSDANMLLLDEPNNYLDIVAIRWLIKFLQNWKGELILITHDRSFMDKVVTHTVAIHRNKARKIEGNTEKLYAQIEREEEIYEKTRINREKQKKKTELFIRRFRAKARLAGMVQSRIKTLEKQQDMEELTELESLDFSFNGLHFPSSKMMSVHSLKFGYDNNDILIDNLNFDVLKKERICIVGKNGKGKSTLLKLLAEKMQPLSGNIKKHPELKVSYFVQSDVAQLNPNKTIYEEIFSSAQNCLPQQVRNICGAMMFGGDDAMKKISILSGGEKSRVLLGKILLQPCHLLLLDEPTNHLDLESTQALMAAIDEFEGSVIMVTHNENILYNIAEKLIIFDRNKVSMFNGSYEEFLNEKGWEDETDELKAKNEKVKKTSLTKEDIKKLRALLIQEKSKKVKPLELKIKSIEAEIETKENKINEIEQLLIKACQEQNFQYLAQAPKEQKQLKKEVSALYESLVELTQQLEKENLYYQQKMEKICEANFCRLED